jgi:hypothetical protein
VADESSRSAGGGDRWAGALVTLIAVWALLLVPLRILGLGWIPPDDARRHAAKAISGKSWSEVLVLRPEATVDPHPGWHAMLEGFERAGVTTAPGLIKVSVVLLSLLVLVAPIPFLRRPEAWLMTLLLVAVFYRTEVARWLLGRPFLVTLAVLLVLGMVWPRLRESRAPRGALAALAAAIAASTWIHGNWYLWALPLAAFLAAGELRVLGRLAGCMAIGCAAGALLTGHPVAFLHQTAMHPVWALRGAVASTSVTEFHPSDGSPYLLLALAVLALARRSAGLPSAGAVTRPLWLLAATGWVLGLAVQRFWTDWGLPAAMVALALEIQAALEAHPVVSARRRVLATAVVAATVCLALTADSGLRWSKHAANRLGALERVELRPWLPEPGGILYSNSMVVFYDLFLRHPRAPWRYQLGFEPGLMPPADLRIYRNLMDEGGSDGALRPWVERLRPGDRIFLERRGSRAPAIEGTEWIAAQGGLWIGRRRRAGSPAGTGAAPVDDAEGLEPAGDPSVEPEAPAGPDVPADPAR